MSADLLGCFHAGMTARPHKPRDIREQEATENSGSCCGAAGPHGYACTRPPHNAGDHVATGPSLVYERWPFEETHTGGSFAGMLRGKHT